MTLMASKRRDDPPRAAVNAQIEPATYDRLMAEADHHRMTLQAILALIVADAVADFQGLPPDTSPEAIQRAREAYTDLTPRRKQVGSRHVQVTVLVDLPTLCVIDTESRRVGMTRARLVAAILNHAARAAHPRIPLERPMAV